VYLLEVKDPNYIDEPYEEEWKLYLEGATVPDTTTSAGGSTVIAGGTPFIARGTPSYQTTGGTPQKPRKVIASSFRKPQ
jgi:hypothetical protein